MKKRIAMIMIICLAVLSGCQSETDLEAYRTAVEKTEGARKGKSQGQILIDNDFNLEGATKEERKAMAAFEHMELDTIIQYDETRVQNDFYVNFGGLGFDAAYYQAGDLQFIKIPMIGKYMKVNEREMERAWDPELITIFAPVGEEWMRMLKEENIFRGKRHVLATEDGDIKVTRFSIELNEEQIQQLTEVAAQCLEANQEEILASGLLGDPDQSDKLALVQAFAEQVRAASFEDFSFTADIDIDGYLIQDEFQAIVSYGEGNTMTTSLKVKTLYWGFNQEPEFSIPTPMETEWLDDMDPAMNPSFLMEFTGGMTK